METTTLGKTDLRVTRLGFGGIPIQTVAGHDEAVAVVRHAAARGLNFFDTARGYTVSEEIIGEALEAHRDQCIIATKTPSRDVDGVARDFETSLSKLRTTYVDLYQFHNVMDDDSLAKVMAPGGPLEYLQMEQRRGRIRHIGLTSHRLETVVKAASTGRFATVQFPFNYIEDAAAKELYPLAHRLGLGVIAMKPLAGGVMRNAAAAIRWVLSQAIDVAIPGMASIDEVEANLKAAAAGVPGPDELAALERDRQEIGPTFCRRCGYCIPCPEGIQTNFIASSELFFKRSGWGRLTKSHVETFHKGLDCRACRTCEERCPYGLPLSEMVPAISRRMLDRINGLGLKP
ncbi:MAG: aldo/keto reductase [Bacillota bacterium]